MSGNESPYDKSQESEWLNITLDLVNKHPLDRGEIVEVSLGCWDDLFESGIGVKPFKIGIDIFPSPQILSFLLHELIALELERRYPEIWRKERGKNEKDLVCLTDDSFSIEIKASSNLSQVFGNRSYAQPGIQGGKSKKGYYLTINFEALSYTHTNPKIRIIRFGWLDHSDWIAQKAATGQQSRIRSAAYKYKLIEIYHQS